MTPTKTFDDNEGGGDDVSDDVAGDALVSAVVIRGQSGYRQIAGLLQRPRRRRELAVIALQDTHTHARTHTLARVTVVEGARREHQSVTTPRMK